MRILLLGAGGREHALAWKLRQSPRLERLFFLPGASFSAGLESRAARLPGGIAALATPLPGDPCRAADVLDAVRAHRIDLTVIGPEAPLAAGVADALRAAGGAVFGPSRAAARLETSKIFAKQFLLRHAIPTARFALLEVPAAIPAALRGFDYPVVIKADGLAAGKGVVIAAGPAEAQAACAAMLSGALVGAAGRRLLVEEFLEGPEISLLAIADGERFLALPPARDHKRIFAGDRGPNTGGMGAVSHSALLAPELRARIEREVIAPTLAGMAAEGAPFQGVLYCGLMLTARGPRVLEFNARFGDPETQPILLRFQGDLALLLEAAARGQLPADGMPFAAQWSADAAACVIAAAAGYPGPTTPGAPISGIEAAAADPDVVVFHAGTRPGPAGWETAGGRVLGVAARAPHLPDALARCYRALSQIHFPGMQFRADIGAAPASSPAKE